MDTHSVSDDKTISVSIRLSRKAYFPGAVVSAVITLEPLNSSEKGTYISYISVQLHGHIGVIPNLATLPNEIKRDRQTRNTISNANVNKFINGSTDCLYQTIPVIIDSDKTIVSQKAYFVQIQLPTEILPSMKTSCVRYFHLLSFCVASDQSSPHFISIPITVQAYPLYYPSSYNCDNEYSVMIAMIPIETKSFCEDITDDYLAKQSLSVSEDDLFQNDTNPTLNNDPIVPLEFNQLYHIDVNQSIHDNIWSREKYYTSYADFMQADPNLLSSDTDAVIRQKTDFGIFGITHNNQVICNMQLMISPVYQGESFRLIADFSETDLPCEQMIISLYYEEYSPFLKKRIIKSELVNSITVNTRSLLKFPHSFSIPAVYPPSITTQQVAVLWKLRFSFFFNPKVITSNVKVKNGDMIDENTPYMFNPEEYLTQPLTKVDWTYTVKSKMATNEKFGDVIGEKGEIGGKEESFVV